MLLGWLAWLSSVDSSQRGSPLLRRQLRYGAQSPASARALGEPQYRLMMETSMPALSNYVWLVLYLLEGFSGAHPRPAPAAASRSRSLSHSLCSQPIRQVSQPGSAVKDAHLARVLSLVVGHAGGTVFACGTVDGAMTHTRCSQCAHTARARPRTGHGAVRRCFLTLLFGARWSQPC